MRPKSKTKKHIVPLQQVIFESSPIPPIDDSTTPSRQYPSPPETSCLVETHAGKDHSLTLNPLVKNKRPEFRTTFPTIPSPTRNWNILLVQLLSPHLAATRTLSLQLSTSLKPLFQLIESSISGGLNYTSTVSYSTQRVLMISQQEKAKRYKNLATIPFVPCKFHDTKVLAKLGILVEVIVYLQNIGWENFMSFACPAYTELTQEFYAIFQYAPPLDFTPDSPDLIKFCLMNHRFKLSFTELIIALGFLNPDLAQTSDYADYICDFFDDFSGERYDFGHEISTDKADFNSRESKAYFIKEPALRILHKLLAHSLSARNKGSNVCTKADLCFLWCMKRNKKSNFARWVITEFKSIVENKSTKKGLILGYFITCITVHYNLIDLNNSNLQVTFPIERIDLPCFINCHIVKDNNGILEFKPLGVSVREKTNTAGTEALREDEMEVLTIRDCLNNLETRLDAIAPTQELILSDNAILRGMVQQLLVRESDQPPPPTS